MPEINMRFSPRVVVGSVEVFAADAKERGDRALIVADSSFERAAQGVQRRLDGQGIDTIMFVRENLQGDTAALDEALSLARGSRTRTVVGLGGEDVLSLARIIAAAAPGPDKAATMMKEKGVDGEGLPLLEIPAGEGHALLYRRTAKLIDTATHRTELISLPFYFSHNVVVDPLLAGAGTPGAAAQSIADLLAVSTEALLSPRSTFLSDIQARRAVSETADLLRAVKREFSDPDFRLRTSQAAVVSAFSTGLTGLGPLMVLAMAVAAIARISRASVYTVLLPWALESPLYAGSPQSRSLARLAAEPGEEPSDRPEDEVRSLFGRLGLPGRLRDLGADLESLFPASGWAAAMLGSDRGDLGESTFQDLLEIAS